VEVPAGKGFTLHAVLAAEPAVGERHYYTEAPRVEIGGRELPAAALRRWDRQDPVRVLWFTVEGNTPYLPLATAADLDRFAVREFFRADWPNAWAVPGSLEPANDDGLERQLVGRDQPFGTQRYHVRVEIFSPGNTLAPRQRGSSWGAADLEARGDAFPTVVASLPGPLATPSRVFGLTEIEPAAVLEPPALERVADLLRRELAFTGVWALEQACRAAGASCAALEWRPVAWGAAWEKDVAAGDLLRAGDATVVLYRDAGEVGRLDGADLALVYRRGAAVRALADALPPDAAPEVARLPSPL
jgi:hypothetical protein